MNRFTTLDIYSMNGDFFRFCFDLEVTEENSKSIHCRSNLYGDLYRIEKATGKVFRNGKQIADTCKYDIF